ncbi:MAG: hypothetical protein II677_04020 [Muribaculaceae bacterium]|nr:hypothetical protein [Muribaculaceae bacterium]
MGNSHDQNYYLYLKLTAATCFRNRTRIVLTLIGICIGLIVFLLGNAAISGYMKQLYRSADAFAENTYVLTGYPQDVAWFEEKLGGKADCRKRSYSVLDSFSATPFYSYQSHMISNSVHLIGTEADMLQDPTRNRPYSTLSESTKPEASSQQTERLTIYPRVHKLPWDYQC